MSVHVHETPGGRKLTHKHIETGTIVAYQLMGQCPRYSMKVAGTTSARKQSLELPGAKIDRNRVLERLQCQCCDSFVSLLSTKSGEASQAYGNRPIDVVVNSVRIFT